MREAGEKDSQAVKRATSQCDDARSLAIQPQAAEERSKPKNKNADRKGQRYFGDAPAELLREWDTENAPGIDRAESDLQKHSSDCDDPATARSHALITMELPKCRPWESRRRLPCRFSDAPCTVPTACEQ